MAYKLYYIHVSDFGTGKKAAVKASKCIKEKLGVRLRSEYFSEDMDRTAYPTAIKCILDDGDRVRWFSKPTEEKLLDVERNCLLYDKIRLYADENNVHFGEL